MTAAHTRPFSGQTFNRALDGKRLSAQHDRVLALMSDARWRTLGEILRAVGGASEAGVSARLRELRRAEFGGHTVERRRRGDPCKGLNEYRLVRQGEPEQLRLGV